MPERSLHIKDRGGSAIPLERVAETAARLERELAKAIVGNLAPIVNHLRSLSRTEVHETVHPMRSGWWILPLALALCAEWTLRRRRGER